MRAFAVRGARRVMNKRGVALGGLLLTALCAPAQLWAREPEGVSWRLVEGVRQGEFQPGVTPGGDVRLLVNLFPSDDAFAKQHLLVRFPGCGEDPGTPNKPILNLEEVLRGSVGRRGGSGPIRNDQWQDPGPRWRICPEEQVVLLEGQDSSLVVSVDFLRAVNEGVSPRLVGEVHVLSDEDLERLGRQGSPAELAAIA